MSDGTKNQELAAHGWTAVPRAQSKVISHVDKNSPAKISVDTVKLPDSEIVKNAYEYAKRELPEKTFNHSMRVYYFGKYHISVLFFCRVLQSMLHWRIRRDKKERNQSLSPY